MDCSISKIFQTWEIFRMHDKTLSFVLIKVSGSASNHWSETSREGVGVESKLHQFQGVHQLTKLLSVVAENEGETRNGSEPRNWSFLIK